MNLVKLTELNGCERLIQKRFGRFDQILEPLKIQDFYKCKLELDVLSESKSNEVLRLGLNNH